MSYDLRVWTVRRPGTGEAITSDALLASRVLASGSGWQVVASSVEIDLDDVPTTVAAALPGIAFLTEISLEPISAPPAAHTALRRAAKEIASAAHGAVEDPQENTLQLGASVRRLDPLSDTEDATLLAMSWWFVGGPLAETRVDGLLALLERSLPEALPWRYGLTEPAKHRFDRDGRAHFLDFYATHGRTIFVWQPKAPVANVFLHVPPAIGPTPQGFRAGRLQIDVDARVLDQPGWPVALAGAWRRLSVFMRPFYGDVRHLRHHARGRGRYWTTAATEQHPIASWWWAGIPEGPTLATVIGPPYARMWRGFDDGAERAGELLLRAAADWRAGAAPLRLPPAPDDARQPRSEARGVNPNRKYPKSWPFAGPRS